MRRRVRWLVLSLAVAAGGCGEDADRLARISHRTAARFDGATAGLRQRLQGGWGAVRSSAGASGLDSRVALRLRWDTDLAGAELEVRPAGPAAVELTGTVADLPQRIRAVHLAQTTAGVERVVDSLVVEADADRP